MSKFTQNLIKMKTDYYYYLGSKELKNYYNLERLVSCKMIGNILTLAKS